MSVSKQASEIILAEVRSVMKNPAVMAVVFGALVIYSFLYPLPYANQVVIQQAIIAVDLDKTGSSRALLRAVSATPEANIVGQVHSVAEARSLMMASSNGQTPLVRGFMVIPQNFERDILLGRSPTLAFTGDASVFLSYGAIVNGMLSASREFATKVNWVRQTALADGGLVQNKPIAPFTSRPVYNDNLVYLSYILPPVFIFILHQLMVMSAALHGSFERVKGIVFADLSIPSFLGVLFARWLVLGTLFTVGMLYYFAYSLPSYDVRLSGDWVALVMLLFPFGFACIMLGSLIGQCIPQPKYATVILLLVSSPVLFSLGFVWPKTLIPEWITLGAEFFPAAPIIRGFLKLTQMQATPHDIIGDCTQAWLQGVVYMLVTLACKRGLFNTVDNEQI